MLPVSADAELPEQAPPVVQAVPTCNKSSRSAQCARMRMYCADSMRENVSALCTSRTQNAVRSHGETCARACGPSAPVCCFFSYAQAARRSVVDLGPGRAR